MVQRRRSRIQNSQRSNWRNLYRYPKISTTCLIELDKKCPFTGQISIRGRILSGVVVSAKMHRTVIIRYNSWQTELTGVLDVIISILWKNITGTRNDIRILLLMFHLVSVSRRVIWLLWDNVGRWARLFDSTCWKLIGVMKEASSLESSRSGGYWISVVVHGM